MAAVTRLHEWLALETTRALRTPGPDEAVLGLLVAGYVRVALEATDLLAVRLTERLYLPDAARERIDRIQADEVAEWQRWLSAARPDLPDADAGQDREDDRRRLRTDPPPPALPRGAGRADGRRPRRARSSPSHRAPG
ncbi:hypothetical protein [Pseudonocardia sp. HH130629-09]|uniref:hypothetical protein n=1 Tax=Pseudonocardia sp. HH130629-09 TaxID=1641402 RepID=UPI0006CB63DF|nr:hypothetical protein [Pseudonocardia sp. HH130629-09]ALE82825.1 hypothetical protein XF36_06350 [Pseudonocardia sp. HH130629-09]